MIYTMEQIHTKKQPILSVLILSITERLNLLNTLITHLESICPYDTVEILVLLDNRKQSITEKRNKLLNDSNGKYITFLDDDDGVFDNYFKEIIPICELDKYDVITFDQHCNVNGFEFIVEFKHGNPTERVNYHYLQSNSSYKVKRPPWHNCIWKKDLAITESFHEMRNSIDEVGEDFYWISKLNPKVLNPYKIEEVLHKYMYRSEISRATERN